VTEPTTRIGFSQRIRLEWLDATASLILAGNDRRAIDASLQALLADKVSVGGRATRGNREKTITILMKTWLDMPQGLGPLRDAGLELLRGLSRDDRIAVHWGMVLAAYPFWGSVAAHTGRLLRLQDSVGAAQVQRRIRERYGERPTVERATRRVLRTFIDWGVLDDTATRGLYVRGRRHTIQAPECIAWLAEAVLTARSSGAATAKDLLASQALFPFNLAPMTAQQVASLSSRLDVLRHGLDEDLVMLRSERRGRERRGQPTACNLTAPPASSPTPSRRS